MFHLRNHPGKKLAVTFDSAASDNYVRPADRKLLTNVEPYSGPPVLLPDADELAPIEQGQLPLSNNFSTQAKNAKILKNLRSASLFIDG